MRAILAAAALGLVLTGCDLLPGGDGDGRPGQDGEQTAQAQDPTAALPGAFERMLTTPEELTPQDRDALSGAQMHFNMANEELRQDRLHKAAERFERALVLVNDYLPAMVGVGRTYHRLRKYGAALKSYEQSLELSRRLQPGNRPQEAMIHLYMGNLYADCERYEEAITSFQTALELVPDMTPAHYALGHLYLEQGEWALATERFNRTLELDGSPDYYKARVGRAIANHRMGNHARAWEDLMFLEQNGMQVSDSLKASIRTAMKEKRRGELFRPGS